MDDLSDRIDDVSDFEIIDEVLLDKLLASLVHKPKKLIAPIKRLVEIADLYQDALDDVAEEVSEMLDDMTDDIKSDEMTADYYETKKKDVTNDQVIALCDKIDKAYEYVADFVAKIDAKKTQLVKKLSPNVLKFAEGIKNLTTNYNTAEANIEEAKEYVQKLVAQIESETKEVISNSDEALEEFETAMRADGVHCESFFSELAHTFAEILHENKKNWFFFKSNSIEAFKLQLRIFHNENSVNSNTILCFYCIFLLAINVQLTSKN